MSEKKRYTNFPKKIVFFRVSLLLAIVTAAAMIMAQIQLWLTVSYIIATVAVYFFVIATACKHCIYRGKRCDLGFSILATKLFKNANTDFKKFKKCALRSLPFLGITTVTPIIVALVALSKQYRPSLLIALFAYCGLSIFFLIITPIISCSHCRMAPHCPGNILKK